MVKIEWFDGYPPQNMIVRQVYGVAFDSHGRILLKIDNSTPEKDYNLPGGKPEVYDNNYNETLKREFIEEVNTKLKNDFCIIGYQTIEGDNDLPVYAQMRKVCIIDNIGEKLPDSDNGKIYDRLLTNPESAKKLLSWGEIGNHLIDSATKIAKEKFGISFDNSPDEYV